MKQGVMSSKRAKRLQKMREHINTSEYALDYKDMSDVFGISPAQASLDLKLLLGNGKVKKDNVFYGKTVEDIFDDDEPLRRIK